MTVRTVAVHLRMRVSEYLAGGERAEKATRSLRQEVRRLDDAGARLNRGALMASLAAVPGLAAPAGAALAALPSAALAGGAAMATLAVATNGVGDALTAVAEDDAAKFAEAMNGLTDEARQFVLAYERIRPLLSELGAGTQGAFFRELNGALETLTGSYLPTLQQQMPLLAASMGRTGREFAEFVGQPQRVAQVGRQFELATDLVGDFSRTLRAGTGALLDLADAGAHFTRWASSGLAGGTEAFERWLDSARATGQLDALFANAQRTLSGLAGVAAQTGELLFDMVADPQLADGAETFIDLVSILLRVLQGVLDVFQLLPDGMQSTVATTVAVGAAVLVLTGRVLALRAALESAKASAISTGAALKSVGAFMGGPLGVALTTATVLLGAFTGAQAKARNAADSLRGTLDEQTGAITEATRRMVADNLEKEGALALAQKLGLNIEELTAAVLAGSDATEAYYKRQIELAGGFDKASSDFSPLITKIGGAAAAVDEATAAAARNRTALGLAGDAAGYAAGKYGEQERAVRGLSDALRAQTDPVFALIKAQRDVAAAQADYTEAVKRNGPRSKEAEQAALAAAQSTVVLAGAVAQAGAAFDGTLSPALEAALGAAGLTATEIETVRKAFQDARTAGDAFAKTYNANVAVTTPGLDAALAKLARLAELGRKARFSVNVYDPEGLASVSRRWGGVTTHAQTGTLRDAGVYSSISPARYAFAEPTTGGEAFVPRHGDYGRSMSILDQAAAWYGARVVPGSTGSTSAQVAAAAPALSPVQLARAIASALHGVAVVVDGRRIGQIQAREADILARSGM